MLFFDDFDEYSQMRVAPFGKVQDFNEFSKLIGLKPFSSKIMKCVKIVL